MSDITPEINPAVRQQVLQVVDPAAAAAMLAGPPPSSTTSSSPRTGGVRSGSVIEGRASGFLLGTLGEGLSVNEYVRHASKSSAPRREKPEHHTGHQRKQASISDGHPGIPRPSKEKGPHMTVTQHRERKEKL
jgi:hypothetical protein